jgi:hypothetical protein
LFDKKVGNWVVSGPAPPNHNNSGGVVLRSEQGGYRVYYHDENMAINELSYSSSSEWAHFDSTKNRPIGHDTICAVN